MSARRLPLASAIAGAGVLALVAAGTLRAQNGPTPDWAQLQGETMSHYQALLRIDTSDPPGREADAVAYLRQVLEKEGIAVASCTASSASPGMW